MDGYEATKTIIELQKDLDENSKVPVVGLTASADTKTHQDCMQAGMKDVLEKPVQLVPLRALLKKIRARIDPSRATRLTISSPPSLQSGHTPQGLKTTSSDSTSPLISIFKDASAKSHDSSSSSTRLPIPLHIKAKNE